MAKSKQKKKHSNVIKKPVKKTINPFEIRVNKQKFSVLGRKSKNDRGLPGIARAKSIKKRKETLLQEYKVKDKANKFVDKRIGEYNSSMTQEDRIMARYTAERMKAHNKRTIFNLADDEVLTHGGKALTEIEKYDDPSSDDDDFDGRGGGLSGEIVDAHFGGGIFQDKGDGAKTHKSLIEELIEESKKRKAERQYAKEQTLKLTEELDSEWRDLMPLLSSGKGNESGVQRPDHYDQTLRELKFEACGRPSDRLKSDDEIAKQEKERLEKLEDERIKRMKGLDDLKISSEPKHRSADDLDDGLIIEETIEDDEKSKDLLTQKIDTNAEETSDYDDDNDSDEDEDEVDKDHDESAVEVGADTDYIVDDNKETVKSDNEESENDDDGDNDDEFDDDLSDLKESDNDDNNENVMEVIKKSEIKQLVSETKEPVSEITPQPTSVDIKTDDKFLEALKEKKKQMDEARKELPYTFSVPKSYEELENIMKNRTVDQQAIIFERMIKCNHPSLGDTNKSKLEELFAFSLQLLNDADESVIWRLLDRLAPHLYDLTQFSPENAARCLSEVLKEKHDDFINHRHIFPGSDTLIFLKLVPLLFPTSDIRHKITTPAFIFLSELLTQCRVNDRKSISTGLFVVTMLLEYTTLSNRYCPEVVNFLQAILEMAVLEAPVSLPYCKSNYHPLILGESALSESDENRKLTFEDITSNNSPIDDLFRIRVLNTEVHLLKLCSKQIENIASYKTIFQPISKLLEQLQLITYPKCLRDEILNVRKMMNNLFSRKLQHIKLGAKKLKPLRLYEPKIERVVDGKKRYDISEEKAEQQKLLAKYKKEMKGALREIRRDNAFITNIQLRKQAKADEERKRKVKEIYGWGAAQEGEFNKLKRKRKR